MPVLSDLIAVPEVDQRQSASMAKSVREKIGVAVIGRCRDGRRRRRRVGGVPPTNRRRIAARWMSVQAVASALRPASRARSSHQGDEVRWLPAVDVNRLMFGFARAIVFFLVMRSNGKMSRRR
jgi:hypothetical protein